jgi:hypothetical protein
LGSLPRLAAAVSGEAFEEASDPFRSLVLARHIPIKTVIRPSRAWLAECTQWLITKEQMAEFLGVEVRQVRYLHASGRIPQPIRLFLGPPRYSVPELRDWLRMGCQPLSDWIKLRRISGNIPQYEWGWRLNDLDFANPPPMARCVEPRD